MDIIETIIKTVSETGMIYLDDKINKKLDNTKKAAFGFYIGNLLISGLISLLIFFIGIGTFIAFLNTDLITPHLIISNFFIGASAVSLILITVFLILYIKYIKKQHAETKKNEILEKLIPSIEKIIMLIHENSSTQKEIKSLREQNLVLQKDIEELKQKDKAVQ